MGDLINVVARLRALQHGQAVAVVSQRQLVIQPHARVLTMLAMAGEDTSVHAIALGRFGEAPIINICPDPRRRDDQNALLRWLLPYIESYYAECRAGGTFPQLWVSSAGALGHLDTLADRLRFTDEPSIQRLGNLLTYAGERSPIAGQQALISATAALCAHYATGQQEAEDEHLGALLTWIEPPPGRDIFASVAMAEQHPMGVKTDPRFDRNVLEPAIVNFHLAVDTGEPETVVAFQRIRIQQCLETVIRPIYAATQRALALLSEARWGANLGMADLEAEEARAFQRFMIDRDEGHFLLYNDRPKASAMKIVARENAVANVEAGMLRNDRAAREKGVMNGTVVRAQIIDIVEERVRPRVFEYHIELTSHQESLHLRKGDVLWTLEGPKQSFRINDVQRRGPFTWISGTILEGKRAAKRMVSGVTLDFGPKAPNWEGIKNELGQMSVRLANAPWTHGGNLPEAAPVSRPRPANLIAAVEQLT